MINSETNSPDLLSLELRGKSNLKKRKENNKDKHQSDVKIIVTKKRLVLVQLKSSYSTYPKEMH